MDALDLNSNYVVVILYLRAVPLSSYIESRKSC